MARMPWSSHAARQAALLAVQVVLALALGGIAIVLSERHNRRYDLTPTQSFVLSDQSLKIARKVTERVKIYAFCSSQEAGQRRQVEDLLEQFSAASPAIDFGLYDLDRSPGLAKKFTIASYNTGVIEGGQRVVPLSSLDEIEITNALLKLSARGPRTLCFLTGHGEHSPSENSERRGYSEVAKALERENFGVRVIERLPPEGVPADCTVVISAGPTRDLFPGEADQLEAAARRGGRLFFLVDPEASAAVAALLARFNIKLNPDLIVDERNRFFGADSFMPRVPIFDEGTFRKNLETAAVFSLARSLEPVEENRAGVVVSLLALTSPESWARIDTQAPPEGNVRFRPTVDKNGPLPVAVMANVTNTAESDGGQSAAPGRVAVFGDSDFAGNLYLNLMGNKDLFMSTVAVLAEDEDLVAVRRKGLQHGSLSPISLTARQGRMIFWSAVVVQPAVLLLIGIVVTARRRRRGGT
ncbi:MAG: GldG family protein [Deltaproteobacteria bacterium]|nr:GldG family protein [Deltaproteobacteria bacterium]